MVGHQARGPVVTVPLKRLLPQRGPATAVIMLSIAGIAISAVGPRILGHATDLILNGVIGRGLPSRRGRPRPRR